MIKKIGIIKQHKNCHKNMRLNSIKTNLFKV